MRWIGCLSAILVIALAGCSPVQAANGEPFAAFYFHGIGCSHCKNVDQALFPGWLENSSGLVVIEYEVFRDRENALVMARFDEQYGIGSGVPVLLVNPDTAWIGDRAILAETPRLLGECEADLAFCRQNTAPFRSLNLADLAGHPRIWYRDRVLILQGPVDDGGALQRLLVGQSVPESLKNIPHTRIAPAPIPFSGQNLTFQNAVQMEGAVFQWNASELPGSPPGDQKPGGVDSPPRQAPLVYAPILAVPFCLVLSGMRKKTP
ncbi:MAG: hypothetical protein QMD46_02365 [Methanomicrobiales archaeon]|nr:hypothetical protein [Methanomicrobiales archaeon]MDI6875282.1 hypothetical protein [Methanomicrobiales archaeon]